VIHSFWVPEWRIKRDVVPAGPGGNDIDNTVEVTPDRLGTYNVVCTELCGFGHATMRALVRVVPKADFDQWLKHQKEVTPQSGTPTGEVTGAPSGGTIPSTTTTTSPNVPTPPIEGQ
jgi:cytochrome c oxidase subunit 2